MLSNEGLVTPENLVTELNGRLAPDDYLGLSVAALNSFQPKEPQTDEAGVVDFEDLHVLLEPGYSSLLEHGYAKRKDGTLYVAVLSDLGSEVTPEMLDWWFSQCDNGDKHRWWHPRAHQGACAFDPPFYAAMAFERPPQHYVGHVQTVEERIGGGSHTLRYEYLRPNRFLDMRGVEEGVVLARLHLDHPRYGSMALGYVAHIIRQVDGRTELRSRVWLGDFFFEETPENYYVAQALTRLANTPLLRSMHLSASLAQQVYSQLGQKMQCLRAFLPAYYAQAQREQENLLSSFQFN
ncbi:hypothetical protein EON64_05795 [archaeon]|nr:MAG: hypothetical protein EON64_05795 [archaeon]